MARIRTIKPDFFLSEQLAPVKYEWRLLFIGLWTQADRNGRLKDSHMRIKAVLFPYDDLDVNEGLGCLANAGLITRYERDGAKYIAIPTWHKHQQPHIREVDGKIPPPPLGEDVSGTVPARDKHRASTPDQGTDPDQGREGDPLRARGAQETLDERFERFWEAYPRKVGKDAARGVWRRLKPSEALTAAMLAAVATQAQSHQWRRDGGQYIPHPRTWLNQGRWQDGADIAPRASAGQQPQQLPNKASKFAHLTNRDIPA